MTQFQDRITEILEAKAASKGYGEALRIVCRSLPHALAEIVYKAVRFHVKRDPDDLVKIAAWAELEYDDHVDRTGSASRDTKGTGFTRPADQGLKPRIADSCAGDAGSYSRGPRRGEGAEVIFPAFDPDVHVTGRTGAGGGHRRTVGGKHRQRKGKGRT